MEWQETNNKIEKEFTFKGFNEALKFINRVGDLANEYDHHPDIFLHDYKQVKIILTTHSEGKVTEKDLKLSKLIDGLI